MSAPSNQTPDFASRINVDIAAWKTLGEVKPGEKIAISPTDQKVQISKGNAFSFIGRINQSLSRTTDRMSGQIAKKEGLEDAIDKIYSNTLSRVKEFKAPLPHEARSAEIADAALSALKSLRTNISESTKGLENLAQTYDKKSPETASAIRGIKDRISSNTNELLREIDTRIRDLRLVSLGGSTAQHSQMDVANAEAFRQQLINKAVGGGSTSIAKPQVHPSITQFLEEIQAKAKTSQAGVTVLSKELSAMVTKLGKELEAPMLKGKKITLTPGDAENIKATCRECLDQATAGDVSASAIFSLRDAKNAIAEQVDALFADLQGKLRDMEPFG